MAERQANHVDTRLLIWFAAITAGVLVVGLSLIAAGSNEAFYSSDPVVQGIFGIITQAGDELFFIVVISFLYFGADKVFGRKLLYGFLISTQVNLLGKAICTDPRPITNGTEETNPYFEEGFGFPSGHSQSTVAFWGYGIAATRGRTYSLAVKAVGAAMLVLVPVSRLVLGVHDVQDVTGGFVIGAVVLLVYLLAEEYILPRVSLDWTARLSLGVAAWMTLWVFSILAVPGAAADFGQPCGLLVGVAIGVPIEEVKVKFDPASLPVPKRALAGIIGSLITIGTYFALSLAFGGIPTAPHIWRFIRYAILGFLVSLVYAWLLKKITRQ
ncbi:MAG: phosphatase PAP2 family protein [Candidatus Lokiarchaeota archaeon]|nr:phosphatase PAP2 family protein [Candidatus Lokiarchaeota archaeon]